VDFTLVSKRRRWGYEEWYIRYPSACQEPDVPKAVGEVPAYLLVPGRVNPPGTEPAKTCHMSLPPLPAPPYPAMVCFHQCFNDCDVGKEAVVGKAVARPDQAYGLELVRLGFVVLAPDNPQCGERNLPGFRIEGERKGCETCGALQPEPEWCAVIRDGSRAVDVLQALDFVDAERVGAIGHSGGGFWTIHTMMQDARVKVGVASGFGLDAAQLKKIAPRPFIHLIGTLDEDPETIQQIRAAHGEAAPLYAERGASDELMLWTPDCSHVFLDDFKWEAYARLKCLFGMNGQARLIPVGETLQTVIDSVEWAWPWKTRPTLSATGKEAVMAAPAELEALLYCVIVALTARPPYDSGLDIRVGSDDEAVEVSVEVQGGAWEPRACQDHLLREAEMYAVFCSAGCERLSSPEGIELRLRFRETRPR